MRLLILLIALAAPGWGAYGYYIHYTPAASQVDNGPHTDFPVLIDTTHNDLRTTGNGGFVTDPQGDDIVPHTDAACSSPITAFDLVAYDGTNGRIRMHVNISSLSSSSNLYLCFGNSAITTPQGTATSTWNSGFVAVYHLGDGSTCGTSDSTTNALTLTNTGTVNGTTGKIYGACGTNWGTTRYLERANSATWNMTSAMTISAWVKAGTFSSYRTIIAKVNTAASVRAFELDTELTTGKLRGIVTVSSSLKVAVSSSVVSTSAFNHVAFAADTTDIQTYINGAADGSAVSTGGSLDTNTDKICIGALCVSPPTDTWDGTVDEIRVSNVRRSAGWLATEYNSGTPSTFWTTGSPTAVTTSKRRMIIIQCSCYCSFSLFNHLLRLLISNSTARQAHR